MPNTYTRLHYHIIFGTKNRKRFLRDPDAMHQYLGGCIRGLGGVPVRIGGVDDHVHLLVGLKPTHCLANVLQAIKKGSSEWIREHVPLFHWQDGYSAFTVSRSHINLVTNYIAGQAEHH